MLKTDSIKMYLTNVAEGDLANLYSSAMEVQVNVAQGSGEREIGEFKGKKFQSFTDGKSHWKAFRIPYNANSEPEYTDSDIHFDLAEHAEAIGMTGWNWQERKSLWVAFDFDAIVGHAERHSKKLSNDDLESVRQAACKIPWVTVRKSSSGSGLHLYVHLKGIATANHTEHAALGRSILNLLAATTGFDFKSKVDNCGGNMWVWHRKCKGTDGFKLIKQGVILESVPANWRDHLTVVTGKRAKNRPQVIQESEMSLFEEMSGQRENIPLDSDHKRLIDYLTEHFASAWWWDSDYHMLITHTAILKKAHTALALRGTFETLASGSELGTDHNCFLFPLRNGAWGVRRYTTGVTEHESWSNDSAGWTRCFLNKDPDLAEACRANSGIENDKGAFVFTNGLKAAKAARLLGIEINLPDGLLSREMTLRPHKDGRLIVTVARESADKGDGMTGWLAEGGKPWSRIFQPKLDLKAEPELINRDETIRHLVAASSEDAGWVIKAEGTWRNEPLVHVKAGLRALKKYSANEIDTIIGSLIWRAWKLVNKPFQPEYPGSREWNQKAARLRFTPTQELDKLHYPTWLKILTHCGHGIDHSVSLNPWCRANGIKTGGDYLKCWVASLFQFPMDPLPYLFFYSPEQNTGKSSFHEAMSLLLTKGYQRAENALEQNFNGELEGTIIAVLEEVNLQATRGGGQHAYNKIKDWVTSPYINIRHMYQAPFHAPNTTHWIHCANHASYCPIFPGDTRIVPINVPPLALEELISKKRLILNLEKEAPDFLAEILNLELPESNDRLNVPALESTEKSVLEQSNRSPLEEFISDRAVLAHGYKIKFSDFYDQFASWCEQNRIVGVPSKIALGRDLPRAMPKGRWHKDAQHYIGNIKWLLDEAELTKDMEGKKFVLVGEYLEVSHDKS